MPLRHNLSYRSWHKGQDSFFVYSGTDEVLTGGDEDLNCQRNIDVVGRPPDFGANQLAADNSLTDGQNQPAAASQIEPVLESAVNESENGDMLDSIQSDEFYDNILRAYQPDDELAPPEDLNMSQGNRDQIPFTEDFENQDLGALRTKTRYGLREKPTRNKRYFHTVLLEGMGDQVKNLQDSTLVTNKQKHARGILKVFISNKCTKLQELNNLDNLELSQIRAIRSGFLLQREDKIEPKNERLAEYLFRNQFLRSKNALHNQDMENSFKAYRGL